MLAVIATYGQVPDSIARIEKISPQGTLVVKNTGPKALTGVIIVNIIPGEHQGEVVWADRSYTPVVPGEVENTIRLWDEVDTHAKLTDQIKIGAVIFADGTHLGRAINPDYYNKEAVAQIFELRAGLAAGWSQWAAKINAMSVADDNTVVQQFLDAVDAMPEPSMEATTTEYDSGMRDVQIAVKAIANQIRGLRLATGLSADARARTERLGMILAEARRSKAAATDKGLVSEVQQ